jgi:hypothetical protein
MYFSMRLHDLIAASSPVINGASHASDQPQSPIDRDNDGDLLAPPRRSGDAAALKHRKNACHLAYCMCLYMHVMVTFVVMISPNKISFYLLCTFTKIKEYKFEQYVLMICIVGNIVMGDCGQTGLFSSYYCIVHCQLPACCNMQFFT